MACEVMSPMMSPSVPSPTVISPHCTAMACESAKLFAVSPTPPQPLLAPHREHKENKASKSSNAASSTTNHSSAPVAVPCSTHGKSRFELWGSIFEVRAGKCCAPVCIVPSCHKPAWPKCLSPAAQRGPTVPACPICSDDGPKNPAKNLCMSTHVPAQHGPAPSLPAPPAVMLALKNPAKKLYMSTHVNAQHGPAPHLPAPPAAPAPPANSRQSLPPLSHSVHLGRRRLPTHKGHWQGCLWPGVLLQTQQDG